MEPDYSIVGAECIDELTDMRMEFLMGLGHDGDIRDVGELRRANRAFLEERFAAGACAGFLARLGGKAVSALGILTYSLPPLVRPEPRKVAHVLNVYTKPECRGRGYATKLLELAIGWARERGYDRVFLNAMPAGEPMYRRLGFKENEDKALLLKLG
jgi:ribosomal protein S18 acetylase RimI-like enzyme